MIEPAGAAEIAVADIGGTHARFALARLLPGAPPHVSDVVTLRAADHAGIGSAWAAFAAAIGRPLPRAAAFAVAAPITPGLLRFTNSHWVIDPATLRGELGLDDHLLVNDFGAVAHAVAALLTEPEAHFRALCGPDTALPPTGNISIIGPGTGLGIAQLLRTASGYHVIATEGAHIGFSPVDAFEDAVHARLRARHGRTSVERIVSGPGLRELLPPDAAIAALDDKTLWTAAISGSDAVAAAALARFVGALGSFAGDAALIHYPVGVIIAGGLGLRLADYLPQSDFAARFVAKGRYRSVMAALPVKLLTHDQPGLHGAAAAFAQARR